MAFFTRCGNFTTPDTLKLEVRFREGVGIDLKNIDGLLVVFTKAGLSAVNEVFGWRNVGKFLIYTCFNELTRILVCEAVKFVQNNYIM